MDASVYADINQCAYTGLESPVKRQVMPDGTMIKVFTDNFGKYRIVAFKSDSHSVGFSGVLLHPSGEIQYKETDKAMRGKNSTRMLCTLLTVWKIRWYPSQHQTASGAACYK